VDEATRRRIAALYDEWARGDFSSTDWAHPEIEFVSADGTTPGTWRGLEETRAGWREVLNAWDDFRTQAVEFREIADDCLLVLTDNTGRGKVSGFELGDTATRGANVLHLRDGKVVKLVAYWNRDQALADLGLDA
jgi:ketosteroid isomerase-like protein